MLIIGVLSWYLQEKSEIVNDDSAKPLQLSGGSIEFENVHFRYTSISRPLNSQQFIDTHLF